MLNPRSFYSFALWLLLPYIFLRLAWRARKQPEYLHHLSERFGFYFEQSDQPVIWLHTVSVGETRAAQHLITRLLATYPGHRILLTHTTPTGRSASEQLYGDNVLRVYLPYDYPFAVNRFLRHFKPQIGILMETEIWFNLIHASHTVGMPLLLLNARMSEKSARGYARFARLSHEALGGFCTVAAQTTDDAIRLTSLGAQKILVTGNLKFDIAPPTAMLELGKQLRTKFGKTRKVFLAASTRNGEEALLLDAMQRIHISGLLLVIVPRHPQRFEDVATLLEQRGIAFRRRSEMSREDELSDNALSAEIQAVLGDSMGEMFAYYVAADIAFVGGSLLPFGGQNLIESCSVGTPVMVGPYTHNFAEATRLAIAANAAVQVHNSGELAMELQRLLDNPEALQQMHQQCEMFVEQNRGATEKSLQVIATTLKTRAEPHNK